MRGVVLAAGGGTRLRPLTDALPKTLLTVDGERSILELAIANLRAADIDDVVVIVGHAAGEVERRVPGLQRRYGVTLELRHNERFAEWNNAYSLWLARDVFADGALLVNGDTVHPAEVQRRLLDARGGAEVVLALDDHKALAEEEMKVRLDHRGRLTRINKALEPGDVDGEYIGLTLFEPACADRMAEALAATFERDPSLYYEDGFQEYADRGGDIRTASIGGVDWVEVDDHADLERARKIACHY